MTDNLMTLAGAAVIVLAGLAVLAGLIVVAVRALRRRDQEAAAAQMVELARLQAETGSASRGCATCWRAGRPSSTARSTSGSTR